MLIGAAPVISVGKGLSWKFFTQEIGVREDGRLVFHPASDPFFPGPEGKKKAGKHVPSCL
jgi:hypothetical protein